MHINRPRQLSAGPCPPAQASQRTLRTGSALASVLVASSLFAAADVARAQDTFRPPPPVTYTEKYEVYGGINLLNGQAGQNLPKRYNLGGGQIAGTYWLTPKWGVMADGRFEAGTTPVFPAAQSTSPRIQTRPLVTQFIGMGGVQYHWFGNQLAGVNLHGEFGASHGTFDHSNPGLPTTTFFTATGLYTNRTSPMGVAGGSIDFNRSARLAVRIQPEMVFEHFGTEERYFFTVSGGVIYRFGNR